MDLRDMLNNDAGPGRSSSQQEGSQRGSYPPPLVPQRSSSGTYPAPPPQQHQQQHQQPPPPQGYYHQRPPPPHPHDARPSNPSLPSTPMGLHTPQQQFPSSQYPFPPQPQQHHQPPPQQYSPSQAYPQLTPRQQSHPHYPHSMSPTPPGVHRSSHPYPPQHSQPSTPLGPPMQPYNRQSSLVQGQHQRAASGASYALQHQVGMPSQSPAHSLPPQSAYPSESPQQYAKRPSIDYPTNVSERDRSLSVSPKTKVVLPTRQNSTDSSWTARERYPSHEPRAPQRSSTDHAISPLTTTKQSAKISPSQPRIGSQTPGGFRNILNDDSTHHSPLLVSSPAATRGQSIPPHIPQHPHLHHSQSSLSNGSPVQTFEPRAPIKHESQTAFTSESLLQQPIAPPQPMSQPSLPSSQPQSAPQTTLKRPAESEPEPSAPPKKTKKRYAEPPIWARYVPSNPLYDPAVDRMLGPPPDPTQARRPSPRPNLQIIPPQQEQTAPQLQQQSAAVAQSNGHPPQSMMNGHGPVNATKHPFLGPWEPCIKGSMAQSDQFTLHVGKYLFEEILSRADVGVGNAHNGALEIEAKLGTLVDRNTDQRVHLPVQNPVVLDRNMSSRLRFESHMTEAHHKRLNEFLNQAVQESAAIPGRHRLDYKHRYEIDSFAQLSQAGLDALPRSALNYLDPNRQPRLRTSVNERAPPGTDPVIARIVKIRLADLDISCPMSPFDCRISINIEVDMHRPGIDPKAIVDGGETKFGERKKDRLSYTHSVYSVDLTQVKGTDGRKIHELEIEVDAIKLREQAEREAAGQPNGFGDMVQGLVNNMFTLMSVRLN
ncbi:mRNA triphosphatase CET1 [Aureobasidium sp. EXF-10727]|nr:mRNA triphosphatase CET1 [Aureobasidium sp. EXF-10727]KAI4728811.1 mRNA triphosphatase CET1 [Aureobasidium sp. EXF-10728]